MAANWKLLWDEDEPFNAEFHETAASDLLVLLGITHHLPAPMLADPKFIETWVEECKNTCFTIWGDPANPRDQRAILMQLRLHNDVLHDLRQEQAPGLVIHMLEDAQFRLVD